MSKLITSEHTSQQGHWYTKDGIAAYEIVGANGKLRNTTLRDARKLDLVPSVTTIIACAAKPGLTNWLQDQMIMACLTTSREDGESESDYILRIKRDADEHSRIARERGTMIHAWIQGGFEGVELTEEANQYFMNADRELDEKCGKQNWVCEQPFATDCYGGKIDLESDEYVVDIKTTEKDLETIKTWDEHSQQLGAYDRGRGKKCGILYANVLTKNARFILIPSSEIEKGLACFNALLLYWKAKNNFQFYDGHRPWWVNDHAIIHPPCFSPT